MGRASEIEVHAVGAPRKRILSARDSILYNYPPIL